MRKKSRASTTLQWLTTDSSTSQTDVRLLLNYMIIVEYIYSIVLIVLWFNYIFFSLQDEKMYDKLRGPVKKSQVVAEEVHMHMLGTEEAAAVVHVHVCVHT